MTPDRLLRWLLSFPFPGAVAAMQGGDLVITLEGEVLCFDGAWRAPDGQRIPHTLPDVPNADDIHAEIRRGLAIARGITGASWHNVAPEPAPSWEQTKADCVGPDLPGNDALQDRLTDEIDRRKDVEAQLARVTAERDAALAAPAQRLALLDDLLTRLDAKSGGALEALDRLDLTIETLRGERDAERAHVVTLNLHKKEGIEAINAARADLAKMTDAHAVVSQRLVGSQKEVAEVSAERDEATARADRLAAQHEAAHEVIDDARCVPRRSALGLPLSLFDRALAVMQQRRRDDELREQIAVAVGLDGSASWGLILDTVARDRPAREISRLSGLLDVLAAPVTFGERRLSTVERAEWALRRALRDRDECAPRMAQLIDAEVCLDVLGVPAYAAIPSDDPGDASEALTVAERIRLHFADRKDP